MSDEDVRKAKRMTHRLYSLGERNGSRLSGELAQLLVGNVFFQNDVSSNIVKLCLEGADERTSAVPLSKSVRLLMQAREEIPRPFHGRSDCLQSSILDVLLCYISFWGQIFEYYETMYYKPVELQDGSTDQSPANVTFEVGWSITCLFIRDMMLSAAARSAGVASGYDRSMSWYFFPANAVSELEEAKSLVLTVIGKIRKRGTVLVAAEGILGHISFGNAISLTHWVEDNLEKDWSNSERLVVLGHEYFESTSIRLNVNVTHASSLEEPNTALPGDDSPLNSSFLDGLDDYSPTQSASLLSLSARSVSLNVRPITPLLFAHPNCEWSGIDMLEFCKSVLDICVWPQVSNTVSTVGEIGISVLNVSAEVVQKERVRTLTNTPEKVFGALLPFQPTQELTPSGLPNLELISETPFIPIPTLTPTPQKLLPQYTPERNRRDSEVTFFCSEDRPPLADTPAFSPVPPAVACAPAFGAILPPPASIELSSIAAMLAGLARKDSFSAKSWTLELALGDLASVSSLPSLYHQIITGENSGLGGNKRGRKDDPKSASFPTIDSSILAQTETELASSLKIVFARSLSGLPPTERLQVGALARILALVKLALGQSCGIECLVAIAADFVCFAAGCAPLILPTDICATGLRGAYAAGNMGLFEVAKDLGLCDWVSLSLFYNDVAYVVLMDATSGLLNPTTASRKRSQPPQKLAPRANAWAALPEHCLLVGTELTLRWSWVSESRLWDTYSSLARDFNVRRHFGTVPPPKLHTSPAALAELDYFLNLVLMNCGVYLCELSDRLRADPVVIHLAFDLLRAAILLRPTLLVGRHMYHMVYCSLMGAQSIMHPHDDKISFDRMLQAALVKEGTKTAQILINKYVFKSVSLSQTSGGNMGWAHGSGPLILPNSVNLPQPEMSQLGDVCAFYESIFVHEMAQVFFSLKLLVTSQSPLDVGLGPFVAGLGNKHHPSLSPGAFASISSAMGVAMQMATGQGELQFREMHYQYFINAMPLVSPFGALSCLRPPGAPFGETLGKANRVFKWFPEAAVVASSDGHYSVMQESSSN